MEEINELREMLHILYEYNGPDDETVYWKLFHTLEKINERLTKLEEDGNGSNPDIV